MRKNIFILIAVLFSIFLSGCASSTQKVDLIEPNGKNGIMSVETIREGKSKQDLIKIGLLRSAEYTIKSGKTDFMIVSKDINNALGFPINTYSGLVEYCLNENKNNLKYLKGVCFDIFDQTTSWSVIDIVLIDNPSYDVISFNAKEVIEEIKNNK